jgi:hypothetical protein
MDYKVLVSTYTQHYLEAQVVKALAEGWELVGGVSVSSGNMAATPLFAQAVVKHIK